MIKTGIELIAEERQRQIEVEKFSPEHDDRWGKGQLAMAAICYAEPGNHYPEVKPFGFPWDVEWWKPDPKNPIRDLIKAGALIAAEIDRLIRVENLNPTTV